MVDGGVARRDAAVAYWFGGGNTVVTHAPQLLPPLDVTARDPIARLGRAPLHPKHGGPTHGVRHPNHAQLRGRAFELAERSGLSRAMLEDIERGIRLPDLTEFVALGAGLGMTAGAIMRVWETGQRDDRSSRSHPTWARPVVHPVR